MLQFARVTTVVAAIIERNGRVLICQRRPCQWHSLKWEFPGGKLEAGETPRAGLRRELEEELGIQAVIGSEIVRYEYCYAGRDPILLMFYRIDDFEGEPQNLVFERIVWEKREHLADYDFLEGDVDFVRTLR